MRNHRPFRPALPAALLLAAAAAPAAAQDVAARSADDPRWQAWYGCWTAASDSADRTDSAGTAAGGKAPVTCVTPAGGAVVEVTTVAGGRVIGRDLVDASGAQRPFDRDGCRGWERAEWAADGRRVHLRSELACANNVRRAADGVFAFTRAGEWLDVRGATVGGYTGVRTLRYRPASEPSGLPAEVAARLTGRALGVETARAAASAPASTADVVDVNRRAGAPVAAAWLAGLGQRFNLDARGLAALADAGVPGSVTDVLVATAFPQRFALGPSGAERALRDGRGALDDEPARGRPGPVAVMTPGWGGWGGGWGWDGLGFGSLGFGSFGLNSFANGAFVPGLGFVPRGGFWGAGPVVVVRPGPGAGEGSTLRPRVVPGRGYSAGDYTGSGSARPTGSSGSGASASPSVSRGGYSGGGSSGASSGGASSSGGGRTAKPRN
jgi:hypothetical protein